MKAFFVMFGLAAAAPSAPEARDIVSVSGRKLRYRGQRVVLHGVGMGDPVRARQARPASDYSRVARDWHANAVRLAIHPGTWKSVDRDAIVAIFRKEIGAALAKDLLVILTWHVIGWPDGYFENSANDPDFYDLDFQLAKNYWARMAQEFGSEGRVIFELWNEPVHANDRDARISRWWQINVSCRPI